MINSCEEKSRAKQTRLDWWGEGKLQLFLGRIDLIEEVKERCLGEEQSSRGNSLFRDPEAGSCLVGLRTAKRPI